MVELQQQITEVVKTRPSNFTLSHNLNFFKSWIMKGKCFFNADAMLAGGPATFIQFSLGTATATMPMAFQVIQDVFEGKFRGLFSTPVRQSGTDRLGVFKPGNIVAAVAPILGDGLTTDVDQFGLRRQLEVRG